MALATELVCTQGWGIQPRPVARIAFSAALFLSDRHVAGVDRGAIVILLVPVLSVTAAP